MLRSIPAGADMDARVGPGAPPFLPGPPEITVASWMTRQDRDLLIGDNVAYVDAGDRRRGRAAAHDRPARVLSGSPRVWRWRSGAGLRGARKADAVLALGGDVPPELLADAALTFPRVLLARGTRDEWYTDAKLAADEAALRTRGARVETLTFDGAHEWHARLRRAGRRRCCSCRSSLRGPASRRAIVEGCLPKR